MRYLTVLLTLFLTSAIEMRASQADDLTAFRTCVASASGTKWNSGTSTCILEYWASPYMIATPIEISSSAVRYIRAGQGGIPTLQRDLHDVSSQADPFPILVVTSSSVKNLQIIDLIIDGNRSGLNNTMAQPLKCNTSVGGQIWYDVQLEGAGNDGGDGTGVNLQNVDIMNSPGHAIQASAWSYIWDGDYENIRFSGVHAISHTQVVYNRFTDTGAEAIAIAASNVLVAYNVLDGNHREYPYANSGSQIGTGGDLSGVVVLSNNFYGHGVKCTDMYNCSDTNCGVTPAGYLTHGIEIFGPGITLNNNLIHGQSGNGVIVVAPIDGTGLAGNVAITIKNYDPDWPYAPYFISFNDHNGILLTDAAGGSHYFAGTFVFDGVSSLYNTEYGLKFDTTTSSGITINWGTADSACLIQNGPYAMSYEQHPSNTSPPTHTDGYLPGNYRIYPCP